MCHALVSRACDEYVYTLVALVAQEAEAKAEAARELEAEAKRQLAQAKRELARVEERSAELEAREERTQARPENRILRKASGRGATGCRPVQGPIAGEPPGVYTCTISSEGRDPKTFAPTCEAENVSVAGTNRARGERNSSSEKRPKSDTGRFRNRGRKERPVSETRARRRIRI